ncbi:MAG: DUF6879 family protein [Pseudonocardiaceae bacterium]
MQRVHVVTEPLSDYIRWELSWGYEPGTTAGEDVRIIPVSIGEWPIVVRCADFWLFDDAELYDMHYAPTGAWLGVERVLDRRRIERARQCREASLRIAVPWRQYVVGRPELMSRLSGAPIAS